MGGSGGGAGAGGRGIRKVKKMLWVAFSFVHVSFDMFRCFVVVVSVAHCILRCECAYIYVCALLKFSTAFGLEVGEIEIR